MYLSELNKIVNGNITGDIEIKEIKTNSREIEAGDLFLAINKGVNYIEEAINKGAVAVISEVVINYSIPSIQVTSAIEALGQIAKYIRQIYKKPLIAITGSVGKTTTKELVSLVLKEKYNVLKSEKNNNNHIGLPITLLRLNQSYDVVVTELGMNHLNEISYLSKICQPDYAIITNIGSAHIGNLGSKKNILKAKLEILDGMNDGYLLVNNYDKYLKKVKYNKKIKVDAKSLNVKNLKYGEQIEFDIDNVHFVFNSYKHLLSNVFLAIKIGILFNIDLNLISKALANYQNIEGRCNLIKAKWTIIDDSYNSSFESLIGGLESLKDKKEDKIIILGDMLELGNYSEKYHKKINGYLKKIKNKEVLLIGEYTKLIDGRHFDSVDEINNYLITHANDNILIYIKGSHAMNLDKIKELTLSK